MFLTHVIIISINPTLQIRMQHLKDDLKVIIIFKCAFVGVHACVLHFTISSAKKNCMFVKPR